MRRRIIEIGGPGLGDTLSYSTIPEELTRQFGDQVLIRPPSTAWRNPEIAEMWQENPFVHGFAEPGDTGVPFERYEQRLPRSYRSWTLGMENEYGCRPTNEHPRIYRVPKYRREWRAAIFADPTSTSQPFPGQVFDEYVGGVAYQIGFDTQEVVVLESPHMGRFGRDALSTNPRLRVSGLDEYASAITSCDIFLCTESGSQAFASAIKGASPYPHVFALMTSRQFNDRVFVFSNVDYRTTGRWGDWHPYGPRS